MPKRMDWILNSSLAVLALASLLILFSGDRALFNQQLVWYGVGIVAMVMMTRIDWRPLINYPWVIYGIYSIAIVLLIATLFATPIRNIRGWLVLGPWQFQTSEFVKLSLLIVFSSFWAKAHIGIAHLKNVAASFLFFIVPATLVLMQPDMGSTLILFGLWFGYLLVSGIQWKHLLIAAALFLIASGISWNYGLAGYQKERVIGLFYPEQDPLGVNYSVIQSKIAIGSAGWLGKGFGRGTQVRLGFLPEAETDFIFAAFIEEWGLIGGVVALVAFMTVLIRIIFAGLASTNNFSRMFCLGAVILFLVHFILNNGSAIGLLPVIGVPFPFLSYGGSNLLTSLMIVGIIQGIVIRSKF